MTYTENEILTPEVFRFSSEQQEVRTLLVGNEPWLIAKDICDILGLTHTTNAIKALDEEEKLTVKLLQSGQNRPMWLINESGFYTLVMKSNKPEAKIFRKWVTSEVLPSIRKKGYYGSHKKESDFIDARDIPYQRKTINGFTVRFINLENGVWYSLNDFHTAIGSSTGSNQAAKKLNKKQPLAIKVWLFGNTQPAWFTNLLGLELLFSGNRSLPYDSLKLNIKGE